MTDETHLSQSEAPRAPDSYVIDVCVVCGRQAIYPFSCGHRSETKRWTAPIVVRSSRATRRAVQAAIDKVALDV